jgi:hypothetical protein
MPHHSMSHSPAIIGMTSSDIGLQKTENTKRPPLKTFSLGSPSYTIASINGEFNWIPTWEGDMEI